MEGDSVTDKQQIISVEDQRTSPADTEQTGVSKSSLEISPCEIIKKFADLND